MALESTTRVQHLFIDYPNIGEVLRPLTLEFVIDDTLTVEEIEQKNHLERDALLNDLKQFIENEAVTNYVNHTKRDLAKTVHDRYIEDLKSELPVLHIYVKRVSEKILKDENLHHAFDNVMNHITEYSKLLEDTVHPLLESQKPAEVYNAELIQKEKEIVHALSQLRHVTNEYNSDLNNEEVDFVFKRLEQLEKLISEMIALEQLIRR